MPGVTPHGRSRVAQWLVLQAMRGNTKRRAIGEQTRLIGAHQMHHRATEPDMTMEPETTVHRVDHAIATLGKLAGTGGLIGRTKADAATRVIRIVDDGWQVRHRTHTNRGMGKYTPVR